MKELLYLKFVGGGEWGVGSQVQCPSAAFVAVGKGFRVAVEAYGLT